MYLKRPVASRRAKRKAYIDAHRPHGSLVAQSDSGGKLKIAYRHVKAASGDLAEIDKQGAAQRLPERAA